MPRLVMNTELLVGADVWGTATVGCAPLRYDLARNRLTMGAHKEVGFRPFSVLQSRAECNKAWRIILLKMSAEVPYTAVSDYVSRSPEERGRYRRIAEIIWATYTVAAGPGVVKDNPPNCVRCSWVEPRRMDGHRYRVLGSHKLRRGTRDLVTWYWVTTNKPEVTCAARRLRKNGLLTLGQLWGHGCLLAAAEND